jgi:hypothetical protein
MSGTEPRAWATGLTDNVTYAGLDGRKATVCVAVAEGAVVICVGICLARSLVG